MGVNTCANAPRIAREPSASTTTNCSVAGSAVLRSRRTSPACSVASVASSTASSVPPTGIVRVASSGTAAPSVTSTRTTSLPAAWAKASAGVSVTGPVVAAVVSGCTGSLRSPSKISSQLEALTAIGWSSVRDVAPSSATAARLPLDAASGTPNRVVPAVVASSLATRTRYSRCAAVGEESLDGVRQCRHVELRGPVCGRCSPWGGGRCSPRTAP